MDAWLLGSGGWFPSGERETACVFVRDGGYGLLLDAGTGARRLLTEPGLVDGLERLDVVLTHFHLDHVCGLLYLPGLGLERAPTVWGPGEWLYGAPSGELLADLLRSPVSPFDDGAVGFGGELREGPQEVGPYEVRAFPQPRHWDPTAGLRVGDELALVTDTAREPGHAAFAEGVSHLLHEAWSSSTDPIYPDHDATGRDAGTTADEAGVGSLTLVHVNPRLASLDPVLADAREAFPRASLGEDGTSLPIGRDGSARAQS